MKYSIEIDENKDKIIENLKLDSGEEFKRVSKIVNDSQCSYHESQEFAKQLEDITDEDEILDAVYELLDESFITLNFLELRNTIRDYC